MWQEFELPIAKQSLELNTKLSIATAKEIVLCEFEAGSSLLSVSRVVKSEPGIDTISPPGTGRQSVKQSVSTVSNLGSTSCQSVTVPLSADTVSVTTAIGTTVHPSVTTVGNLGSTSCPPVTVPLSADTVSLTAASEKCVCGWHCPGGGFNCTQIFLADGESRVLFPGSEWRGPQCSCKD